MSLRSLRFQPHELLLKSEACFFCQSRQFLRPVLRDAPRCTVPFSTRHNPSPRDHQWTRTYATVNRMTPTQVRMEVDIQSRFNWFTSSRTESMLCVDVPVAEAIFADVRARGDAIDVVSLAKKYKLNVEDIATFAMVVARIPDVQDEVRRSRLPPSIHKPTAKLLLLGCVKAKDSLATLLVLNAVLQSATSCSPEVRRKNKEIASLFNAAELAYCRQELEALAANKDSDAMNLLGQLLEREGQTQHAGILYKAAFETEALIPKPESARTWFLTLQPARNALGKLLFTDKDPEARALAKAAFEKGALKADDPISYYYLAHFEDEQSLNWLRYMNKAAATGHVEAMYKLGNRYLHINAERGNVKDVHRNDSQMKKALKWLDVKQDATQDLAEEWYSVAAGCGHKPAMQALVQLSELKGDTEGAKTYLRKMIEPPPAGEVEEWPRLVEEARRQLRG